MRMLQRLALAAMLIGLSAPLHAQDLYGSIAFSQEDDGGYTWGIAWRFGSRFDATREAVAQCRREAGTSCAEVGWFENACGALAIGSGNGYGAGWGDSTAAAERDALRQCRVSNDNCRIEVARCSDSRQAAGGSGQVEAAVAPSRSGKTDSKSCEAWYPRTETNNSYLESTPLGLPALVWTGNCIDGKAHGHGHAVWCYPTEEDNVGIYGKTTKMVYEGVMRAGKPEGAAAITNALGKVLEGTSRDGIADGGTPAMSWTYIRQVSGWAAADCDTIIDWITE